MAVVVRSHAMVVLAGLNSQLSLPVPLPSMMDLPKNHPKPSAVGSRLLQH